MQNFNVQTINKDSKLICSIQILQGLYKNGVELTNLTKNNTIYVQQIRGTSLWKIPIHHESITHVTTPKCSIINLILCLDLNCV